MIYAEASDEPKKRQAALTLLRKLKLENSGIISTQVLQEYCNVALRKLRLSASYIKAQLAAHEHFEVVQITPAIIRGAFDMQSTHSLSFYDALIVQAAKISGCSTLFTEDLNTGELVEGVRIVNPFS